MYKNLRNRNKVRDSNITNKLRLNINKEFIFLILKQTRTRDCVNDQNGDSEPDHCCEADKGELGNDEAPCNTYFCPRKEEPDECDCDDGLLSCQSDACKSGYHCELSSCPRDNPSALVAFI